jgi:Holliday junction resolvasome RuvABC endonuclease subunit
MTILGIDIGFTVGYTLIMFNEVTKGIQKIIISEINKDNVCINHDEFFNYNLAKEIEDRILKTYTPDYTVFENYVYDPGFLNVIMPEITGQVKRYLVDHHLKFASIPPNTIKFLMLGNGRASKGDIKKFIYGYLKEFFPGALDHKLSFHETDSCLVALLGYKYCINDLSEKALINFEELIIDTRRQ